jgi:hypothetical protein
MPINKKITLREWVRNNIVPAEAEYSAYFLKHEAENGLGFYVRAGELTGALYEAGYLPTEQSCRPWFKYTSLRTYRLEARAFIWDLLMWRYLGLTHHRLRMVFLRREHRRLVARMTEETYAELADVLGEDHA